MDFTEITINDKELFDKHLKFHNPQASEFTFTNFFMWRNYYKFRYSEVNGLLCVISVMDEDRPFAFTPMGRLTEEGITDTVYALKQYFDQKGWKLQFRRVAENDLPYLKKLVSSEENIVYDQDNSDYVYLTENMIELGGKKFDGKRNHIRKFKSQHEYEYAVLDNKKLDECFRIMFEWCESRNCSCHEGKYCERHANMELLSNFEALGCKGAIINVDGKFEAFTAGEMLNNDTAVIHIEKANSSIQGLYPFINQQFCLNEWQNSTYINREQDLGIEGIRKAKLSYNPVKMIEKYSVKIN